jgi:hypothetical protein
MKEIPMPQSVTFCRTQEARQLALAASAPLENSRRVAHLAAAAWAREAQIAERHDARKLRNVTLLHAAPDLPSAEERLWSENPDRGFA